MKRIGLTGNIASGKSTVARLLVGLGAVHLDADALVHTLYEPGTEVTAAVAAHFGPTILTSEGAVDRRALGAIVFAEPEALRALERIVHPWTGRLIAEALAQAEQQPSSPLAFVVEAVKLIESGRHETMDQVWFVTAQEAVQKRRLIEQRGWTEAEAAARLAAQAPLQERLALAHVIIANNGSFEALAQQVGAAWERLVQT